MVTITVFIKFMKFLFLLNLLFLPLPSLQLETLLRLPTLLLLTLHFAAKLYQVSTLMYSFFNIA